MSLLKRFKNSFFLNEAQGYQISTTHHVIFWSIYFLFNTLRWGSYYGDYVYSIKANTLGFPIHMVLSYLTIYVLLPKFIYKKRIVEFIIILLGLIFLMVFLKFELTYFLISNNVWPEGPEETTTFSFDYALVMMLGEFYVISFVTAIKIIINWMGESKKAARLEKTQLETELRFLRTQISPHFFFNTLNNIYSLSLSKSKKTPETILKLSELMRYLLYETTPNLQSLEKEISCVRNYLDLEKIRHGNKLKIDFEVTGEAENKKLPPMLLIPFIENSFKHGANKSRNPVKIDISLKIAHNILYFRCQNTTPNQEDTKKLERLKPIEPKTSGIGIINVKKRLALGYNNEDYDLEIKEENQKFTVDLKLRLK